MKKYIIFMAITCAMILILSGSVAATDQTFIPTNYNVNLTVANDAGARFDDYGNDTYNFFNASQTASQGQNAFHLTTNTSNASGSAVFTNTSSGTFYLSDNGGRGYDDNGILMLAVNGTIPDNFQIHITASGYQWTPVNGAPSQSNIIYNASTLDETFYKSDFIYSPQIWRPAPGANNYYPIFDGQNMSDTSNTFSIMFIDLYAGIIGSGTSYSGTLNDKGMIKVTYTIENLPVGSLAAFDGYVYTVYSNQGQGIRWTNKLSNATSPTTGTSGYYVNGQTPVANFSATPASGNAPLTVQFNDQSAGRDLSYVWDFGDGETSTLKDPVHTYNNPGKYTVTLTAANAAGSNEIVKTDYIIVNNAPVLNSIDNKTVNEAQTLQFTVDGSDADGDTLTYSAGNLPQGANFDPATRTFTWTSDYTQAGSYQVTFTVSDGGLTDSKTMNITVNNVNRSPVLDLIGDKTVGENQTLNFTVSGSDPDNDALNFSATGLPTGASLNSTTGQLTWIPAYGQAGNYQVTFTVSDGSLTDSKTVNITVIDTTAPTVAANPAGGNYYSPQNVVLAASEISDIYYTLDGSDPTKTSEKYSGSVNIGTSKTLKFTAWDSAGNQSLIYKEQYFIYKSVPYSYTIKVPYKKGWYKSWYKVSYKKWYKSGGKWKYYWATKLRYKWKYGWLYKNVVQWSTQNVLT